MIVCINCKSETKAKMDSLLGKDQYRDYSELFAVAVDNLWTMEQEVAKRGALVINESPVPPFVPAASTTLGRAKPTKPSKAAPASMLEPKARKAASAPVACVPVHIPDLFLADGLDSLSAKATKIPAAEEPDEAFTLDRWLFGQYNKLLPVKANCRALLRIAANYPDGVPLEDAAPQIAEAAALLGDYLAVTTAAIRSPATIRWRPPFPQRPGWRKRPRPLRQSVRRQRQQPRRSLRAIVGLPLGRVGAGSGIAFKGDRIRPPTRPPDESCARQLPD